VQSTLPQGISSQEFIQQISDAPCELLELNSRHAGQDKK